MNKLEPKQITLDKAAEILKLATQTITLLSTQLGILKQAALQEIDNSSDQKTRQKLTEAFEDCERMEIKQ